ncbi:hypothetical protein N7481_010775 [Penicillium waksmanii]|uniref:uncharacterized protein n=1 Tax=Penicillium waksmanii TaxID=69791 RepID=UPI002547283C|nr:uncharacterized protein N7481_010775 [Penicillium waksmanii]KAJ5973565.1 hypothetical protein N7481_010775 [Penicillium waksmanii]
MQVLRTKLHTNRPGRPRKRIPSGAWEAKGALDVSYGDHLTYERVVKDEVLVQRMPAIITDPETLVRYSPAKDIPLRSAPAKLRMHYIEAHVYNYTFHSGRLSEALQADHDQGLL